MHPDRGLAEDLVHDAWLYVWARWDEYDPALASIRTWVHDALEWRWRRATHDQPYMRGAPVEGRMIAESDLEPPTGPRIGILESLAVVDPEATDETAPDRWTWEKAWLRSAIEGLSPRRREVIRAVLTGGKQDELAAELGISPDTFRANLYQAKRALRAAAPQDIAA